MDTVLDESQTLREMGSRAGLLRAYEEHQDLLILALTGRTGSGCTTAANQLAEEYQSALAAQHRPIGPDARKYEIVKAFSEKGWIRFSKITVSALLVTFLLEATREQLEAANSAFPIDRKLGEDELQNLWTTLESIRPKVQIVQEILNLNSVDFAKFDWTHSTDIKRQIIAGLPQHLSSVRGALGRKYGSFFQEIGDNLRHSGCAWDHHINEVNLFVLPKRIVRTIECIRECDKVSQTKTRIVIDAIRNPLELIYLRDRYSPLYAIAITAQEEDRRSRLLNSGYSRNDIESIDNREYPKKHDPHASYKTLVTQDIQSCLQKADIFISNPGRKDATKSAKRHATGQLYSQLIRYCALALHPGLVTPSRDERCMQVAFIAKANSGCISRQVGAAVTDENYAVKAIGWNDVPHGQLPCSLRNVDELMTASDKVGYSTFERENDQFRDFVNEKYVNRATLQSDGLPCSYCFKDAVNESVFMKDGRKGTNQVHTRSLHAEENAFLLLANSSSVKGGKLFTTASPCELCSKKAFQLGIRDVIFIDPYPGISESHVMANGDPSIRPVLRLFSGAVGKAYHRLYEPMIPVKDELMARMR
jgi:deoxycytidylate deaminase/dephospho-CoA kinase